MLRTFFTIDFRFLGNFGPDLEKSLYRAPAALPVPFQFLQANTLPPLPYTDGF